MAPRGRMRSLMVGLTLAAVPSCMAPQSGPLTPPEVRERLANEMKARATVPPPEASRPVDSFSALKPYRAEPMAAPKVVTVGLVFANEQATPSDLADAVVQASGRLDPPIVEALRAFQSKQPEQANLFLQRFDKPNQDLLATLLPLAVRLSEGSLRQADPQELAAVIETLNGLVAQLRDRAALQIPKIFFCRPIPAAARFGSYEVLDTNTAFRPGEMVAVYLELRNLSCHTNKGDFQTHVSVSVEVLDSAGHVALRFDRSQADPSLSPRLDYCNIVLFALPELPPGTYTLALKASDVPTGRTARRQLEFRVKAKDEGGGS